MSRREALTLAGAAFAVALTPGCDATDRPSVRGGRTGGTSGEPTSASTSATHSPDGAPTQAADLPAYFPPATGAWEELSPTAAGWSAAGLADVVSFAGDRRSSALVILVGGRIVSETYFGGADITSTRDVASVQKSVTSALVGVAQSAGLLRVDDPVTASLGAGWSGAGTGESAIRIRHLLAMDSGLDERLARVARPETVWFYNTPAYAQLESVLSAAAGRDLQALSAQWLFDPTGMTGATWRPRGRLARAVAGEGLVMTPRDMARFGLLVLAGGMWNGSPVVPGAHLRTCLTASQRLNPSYGWLWWLNGGDTVLLPGSAPRPAPGPLIPTAPDDLVAALGRGDQKIYIVPSRDLVVVRQGARAGRRSADALSTFDAPLWDLITKAMPPATQRRPT